MVSSLTHLLPSLQCSVHSLTQLFCSVLDVSKKCELAGGLNTKCSSAIPTVPHFTKTLSLYIYIHNYFQSTYFIIVLLFCMGEERGVYRVLVGKPERKGPLGRPRRRWVDNIRMDLEEVGCGHVD